MDPVRHILAVFGAIDHAIKDSDDPNLLAAADALLPGASANKGWYASLQGALNPGAAAQEPDLLGVLQNIAKSTKTKNSLTQSQKVRLLYGLSALARLQSVAPGCGVPSFAGTDDAKFAEALQGALAAIAPQDTKRKAAYDAAGASRQEFFTSVADTFTTWHDFDDSVRTLAASTLRAGKPLDAPLCRTAIIDVDGRQCVLVDTEFTSEDVSLEDLKSIVNPFNWDEDYGEFFEDMQEQTPHILPDGWRRVLEKVRLVEGFDLTTPLKYFPYQDKARPFEASLEYDLDEPALATGDRRVLVDRGYIRMTALHGHDPHRKGVSVKTRKIVHIKDIPPWAQARLVCLCGYGTSSADFLLKAAADPPRDRHPFLFPEKESQADNDPTKNPSPAPIHYVPAAVEAWTEVVQDVTNSYLDLTEKWLSGGLSFSDVADHCRRVSGDLGSAPWNYLQDMMTPRSPGRAGDEK
ncbi:MAG: hypothetical protein LLG14_25575 [Nocardiaceae bacterium]|nr:hypothetical protein [Nocardiaceae bacterium]